MSKIKRVEQRVEENSRVSPRGKKIFATLVAEYPDFPNGLSLTQLANAMGLKVQSLLSGDGYRVINDLRDRRYVSVTGKGESAIIAINLEMLK